MVQEYGRYFGMPTCCLRGGCLTGPNHSGVELHGFLSYLVKCNLEGREYTVFGYKGKQVRDNIHASTWRASSTRSSQRRASGEVYNLGGGKANSCSILEAFDRVERLTGQPQVYTYVDQNRVGDHICYYSDLRKMRAHYPGWDITSRLEATDARDRRAWQRRMAGAHAGRPMKTPVTGACGFVGSTLIRRSACEHGLADLSSSASTTSSAPAARRTGRALQRRSASASCTPTSAAASDFESPAAPPTG